MNQLIKCGHHSQDEKCSSGTNGGSSRAGVIVGGTNPGRASVQLYLTEPRRGETAALPEFIAQEVPRFLKAAVEFGDEAASGHVYDAVEGVYTGFITAISVGAIRRSTINLVVKIYILQSTVFTAMDCLLNMS